MSQTTDKLDWLTRSAADLGVTGQPEAIQSLLSAAMMAGADSVSQKAVRLKSINEVLREYRDTLENYVTDAVNGNLTAGKFARNMRDDLIDYANQIYTEGLREGGAEDEFTDEDEGTIGDWILTQSPHVYDLADASVAASKLKGDEKTAARGALFDRVGLWVNSLETLGQKATVNAKGDPMLTFKREGPAAKDPCGDCGKWDGESHRKSFWDKRGLLERNGNTAFACGRWEGCNHHYYYSSNGELAIN